jgi:hypothetical protein
MKTIEEMRARYAEQVADKAREDAEDTDHLRLSWEAALEQKIDAAFSMTYQKAPQKEVVVFSNSLEASQMYSIVMAAASQVVERFSELGFVAKIRKNNGGYVGVSVAWVEDED